MPGEKSASSRLFTDESDETLNPPNAFEQFHIAVFYAALDDKEKAFEWLEKCYEDHNPWLITQLRGIDLAKLYADTRFTDLLRRLGLVE